MSPEYIPAELRLLGKHGIGLMLYVMQLWLIVTRVFESIVVHNTRIFPLYWLKPKKMLYLVQEFWFTADFSKRMLHFVQQFHHLTGLCHTRQAYESNSKQTKRQQQMRLQPLLPSAGQ
jgi:hypothetical protein